MPKKSKGQSVKECDRCQAQTKSGNQCQSFAKFRRAGIGKTAQNVLNLPQATGEPRASRNTENEHDEQNHTLHFTKDRNLKMQR